MKKELFGYIGLIVVAILIILLFSAKRTSDEINLSHMNQSERINWFKSASDMEKQEVLDSKEYYTIVEGNMKSSHKGIFSFRIRSGTYYSTICEYPIFSSEDNIKGVRGYLNFKDINFAKVQFKELAEKEEIQVYSICGEHLGYVRIDNTSSSGYHFVINSQSVAFGR